MAETKTIREARASAILDQVRELASTTIIRCDTAYTPSEAVLWGICELLFEHDIWLDRA